MRVFVVDSGTYGAYIEGVFLDEAAAQALARTTEGRVTAWSVLRELPHDLPAYGPLGAEASATNETAPPAAPAELYLVLTGQWSDYHLDAVFAGEAAARDLAARWNGSVERIEIGRAFPATETWIVRLSLATGDVVATESARFEPGTSTLTAAGVTLVREAWLSRVGVLSDDTVFAWGDTEPEAIKRARDFRASYLAAPDSDARPARVIGVRKADP